MDHVRHQLALARRCLAPAVALLCACRPAPAADAPREGAHIDSVVPRDVALARFRQRLTPVQRLHGGASTREALVRAFIHGLETRDTAALRSLVLSEPEFAYLYYPSARESRPPYDLEPGLLWFMLETRSRQGIVHAFDERGGRSLGYVGHRCEGDAGRQGANRLWGPCVVLRVQATGDTVAERLFGLIVERNGVFKFLSFANKL